MRKVRSALCYTLAATAALIAPALTLAQQYPSKVVKIIVAFPPGGASDFIARLMAQRLTTALGQQFIVENKPGAGGTIGFEAGVRSTPDGYTLTMISSAYTTVPALYKLRFDPIGDITPIIQISQEPFVVAATPSLPVKNVQELIALAKASPGKLNFASAGQGSPSHLAAELFSARTGIRMNHVPYKGGGPAVTDTIAGQTHLFVSPLGTVLPHVRSGRLRAIAVASRHRSAAAPDVPSVAESGLPNYEVPFWNGMAGPKGLPRPIVDRINTEVSMALKSAETGERLRAHGSTAAGGTPEQLLATIKNEIELWREVAREAGVWPE